MKPPAIPYPHLTMMDCGTFRQGKLVAEALAGAWRPTPPPLALDQEELAAAIPLFLRGTAAALAWRRVRHSELGSTKSARRLRDAYRFSLRFCFAVISTSFQTS